MILQMFLASFIASAGFGIIFNVPRQTIVAGGISGMLGWVTYIWFMEALAFEQVFATVVASFLVASISQGFARLYKMPGTIFSIAGIIPLVPGGVAYNTMRYVVEDNYIQALELGIQVFLISGAIAFGLVLAGVFSQALRRKSRGVV